MHVIITAGGTTVPIDDVRSITNGSRGNFPWQIALAFAECGWTVTVVGSERLVERVQLQPLPKGIELRPFTTYDDLVRELDQAIEEYHPDALLMAAAVSDYGPDTTVSGKISSDQDKLVIRLRRLPKILAGLRQRLDKPDFDGHVNHTCLVGFKLTSGSMPEEKLAKARHQLTENHCNLVVANDLSQIGKGQHPITVVTPEGGAIPITGKRDDVAKQLVDLIIRRTNTHWWHTAGGLDKNPGKNVDYSAAKKLLTFAQDTHVFFGSAGNISLRTTHDDHGVIDDNPALWTTPRGWPSKEQMSEQYLTLVQTSGIFWHDDSFLAYHSQLPSFKPSIDTGVHATIYRAWPGVGLLIHTHSPWVLTDTVTEFPYPCGTKEEANEILSVVLPHRPPPDTPLPDRFAVTLVHHGALIGRPKEELPLLIEQWQAVRQEYLVHLDEVQQLPRATDLTLFPVWGRDVPIGIVGRHREGWYVLHLSPQFRGLGWGQKLLQVLIQNKFRVGTVDPCHVAKYYEKNGFRKVMDKADGTMIYEPPKKED